MSFVTTTLVNGSRFGSLAFDLTPSSNVIRNLTPLCLQYTNSATIPHISWDLVSYLKDENAPLLVPISNSYAMKLPVLNHGRGLISYASIDPERALFLVTQDPLKTVKKNYNGKDGISIWSESGRKVVNLTVYNEFINSFKPHFIQSLSDNNTFPDSSIKRIDNSVYYSLQFLNEQLSGINEKKDMPKLFGSVEGGYDLEKRIYCAKEMKDLNLFGYVLDGFQLENVDNDKEWDLIISLVEKTVQILPKNRPKAFFGPTKPENVVRLIKCGIDLFDSSYATSLSESGKALIIDQTESMNIRSHVIKLDLDDFKRDFQVISSSCECYSCSKNFTRAYINHLLNTSEMLAQVLLMLHNVYTYYKLFREMRNCLKESEKSKI